ncbi:MAG: hypothetical protein ABSD62_08620 [Candidatus Limnocylindrales bacterium]|jgi:hypothetical protein
MSDPKPTAESNAGKFLATEMLAPGPMRTLSDQLGPGKPEPDDGWKIPLGPIDEIVGKDDAVPEPARSIHGGSLLRRLTHKG